MADADRILSAKALNSPRRLAFKGTILNPVDDDTIQVLADGTMVLERDAGGRDYRILILDHSARIPRDSMVDIPVVDLTGHAIVPGFYDAHFHWVQDNVCEAPKETLLAWLQKYVFPREAEFSDRKLTAERAVQFAAKLRRMGTFGGAVFGSLHGASVDEAVANFTGEFIVGNTLMDMNAPPTLTHSTEEALRQVKSLARRHGDSYAVTPRFALMTTPYLMKNVTDVARDHHIFVQTHLSEATNEIETILKIYRGMEGFQDVSNVTDIYDRVGVLGPRSIFAHAIHMNADEYRLLARRGASIAHCPTSNAPVEEQGLGSGLFNFRLADDCGVRWALGSDIGAGPYLSMFDVMRSFVDQNRRRGIREATFTRALFRATLAGAMVMGRGETSGNFQPGKWGTFNACPIGFDPRGMGGEEILERLMSPVFRDRSLCTKLVSATFYRGELQWKA